MDFDVAQGIAQNAVAKKYALDRHSVNRHFKSLHTVKRAATIAAYDDGRLTPERSALALAQKDQAAVIASLTKRVEWIVGEAEAQYARFKNSDSAKDIEAMLKLNLSALGELAKLAGAYPKAATTTVDARSISLSGLSQDDLRALVAGLKSFAE